MWGLVKGVAVVAPDMAQGGGDDDLEYVEHDADFRAGRDGGITLTT